MENEDVQGAQKTFAGKGKARSNYVIFLTVTFHPTTQRSHQLVYSSMALVILCCSAQQLALTRSEIERTVEGTCRAGRVVIDCRNRVSEPAKRKVIYE